MAARSFKLTWRARVSRALAREANVFFGLATAFAGAVDLAFIAFMVTAFIACMDTAFDGATVVAFIGTTTTQATKLPVARSQCMPKAAESQ